jgi:hypothetical protein
VQRRPRWCTIPARDLETSGAVCRLDALVPDAINRVRAPPEAEQGHADMATDYDAPRKTEEELNEDSLEELKARRMDKNSGKVDEDEAEAAESFELPGADLSHEELAVRVLPKQADEFTCSVCFLVHHRSQLATERKGLLVCRDCAA